MRSVIPGKAPRLPVRLHGNNHTAFAVADGGGQRVGKFMQLRLIPQAADEDTKPLLTLAVLAKPGDQRLETVAVSRRSFRQCCGRDLFEMMTPAPPPPR